MTGLDLSFASAVADSLYAIGATLAVVVLLLYLKWKAEQTRW